MSDFIYSSNASIGHSLVDSLSYVLPESELSIHFFNGKWGAVAVSSSRYFGFQPIETDSYICIVIGGPVLYFHQNNFIGGDDQQAGTRAILEHWKTGRADWSEDLSGPFVILIIDKNTSLIECITDLMMFIPVYQFCQGEKLFWGTHVDALAKASGEQDNLDEASLVDFILHDAVTYPYTIYRKIRQFQPASVHSLIINREIHGAGLAVPKVYWEPLEHNPFATIDEAARYLYNGVQDYITRITGSLQHVAQFISAGEDSRSLAGMLPQKLDRDAYIFLDRMNREGLLARKVAKIYGANFKPDYRNKTHYLDILPKACALVGSGHQYIHSHTLGFDKKHNLANYRAVFGGYIADSMLKAQYTKKKKLSKLLWFMPQRADIGENRKSTVLHPLFSDQVLNEITTRRSKHFAKVKAMRPNSANEWFELWPATMRAGIPNLYCNRRLFASYEVFMAKESVKSAAKIPVNWKLNRRVFNRAFKPVLYRSRYVFHADGRLPYYPWWVNLQIQLLFRIHRKTLKCLGFNKKYEGPWSDWTRTVASPAWANEVEKCASFKLPKEIQNAVMQGALSESYERLSVLSKVNLLQACYIARRV